MPRAASVADDTTSHQGLTSAEVARLAAEYGQNTVPEPRPPGPLGRVSAQLRDPLIIVLLASMVVTIALRDYADTGVIALVIVLNTTVGVVQELPANQAMSAVPPPATRKEERPLKVQPVDPSAPLAAHIRTGLLTPEVPA